MRGIASAVLCCLIAFPLSSVAAAEANRHVIKVKRGDRSVEGAPLAWSDSFAALLKPDGSLIQLDPRQVQVEKTTRRFEPYTTTAMRRALEQEFGSEFEVTAAGPYLVVHPRGQGRAWAGRFDELYRGFQGYFAVRGFTLNKLEFPLIAIVLRNREEYLRYLQKYAPEMPTSTLGFYSPATNRVLLYDASDGRNNDSWYANAETIIHEATHQTAFNTGIHSRYNATPRWVAEGLGTLFESRGVWSGRAGGSRAERINRKQLAAFRQYLKAGRAADSLAQLIASDQAFRLNAENAYAEAWALTFYLSETRPREYASYLTKIAQQPNFSDYASQQRMADFTAIFGGNLAHLDAQFVRFVNELR